MGTDHHDRSRVKTMYWRIALGLGLFGLGFLIGRQVGRNEEGGPELPLEGHDAPTGGTDTPRASPANDGDRPAD
jgi:hypothetical protein